MVVAETDKRQQSALIAAHLYYIQQQTMDAIARELHTSRSSVSRLLAYARDSGLVEIRLRSPLDEPRRIEAQIRERFSIAAHVAPVPHTVTEGERLERVAATAARVITAMVDSHQRIGVAWGSTMAAVGLHLPPKPTQGSVVVQLNGSGNTQTTGLLYASEILQRFGRAFDATVEQFPVPAFFDHPQTRAAVWKERSTQRILGLHETMDLVAFSVGASEAEVPSHVYSGGYLDADDLVTLREDGVVGDVATVFYRIDGSDGGIRLNARSTGPSFATLRRIPRRVCIVSGNAKLDAIRGALAAGLVTDLVVDELTASALVAP